MISTSEDLAHRVIALVDEILPGMPTADFAGPAWRDHGEVVVVDTLDEAYALADQASAQLGELCGRAARLESFEGHARSGDVRVSKYSGAPLRWAPAGVLWGTHVTRWRAAPR